MQYIGDLVLAFGTPVVSMAIIAYLFYFTKTYAKKHDDIELRLEQGDNKFDLIERNVRKITLITLKQEIMNIDFPLDDRLRAYAQYHELGGNGYMDVYYDEVLRPLAEAVARGEITNFGRRKEDKEERRKEGQG